MIDVSWLDVATAATVSWALGLAVVSGVAIHRGLSRPWSRSSPPATTRLLLIRPCAGREPYLREALRSLAEAVFTIRPIVRLTVADESDPARPVTVAAAAWLRKRGFDARADVVPPEGPNHKTGQLAGVVDPLLHAFDVAMVIDSDVDLAGVDLDSMMGPVSSPDAAVAASWCPPVERLPARTMGDRASAAVLGGSMHAFMILGGLDPGGFVGKAFAVRTDALAAIGGFCGLTHHLGEDMEMARRLRDRGWRTLMVAQSVASLASGRSLRAVVARYARWVLVIRAQRPILLISYPLLLAATPLLLLACLALVSWSPAWALGGGLLTLTARLAIAATAARMAGRQYAFARAIVDTALADTLLLAAFVRALGPPRVRWRKRLLRIGERGLLVS